MASGLDLYFALRVYDFFGYQKASKLTSINEFESAALRLGINFKKNFITLLKHPFASYQSHVEFTVEFLLHCVELARRPKLVSGPEELDRALEPFANSDHFLYASLLDVGMMISYIKLYCRGKSTGKDRTQVRECLRLIRSATDMPEMLERLRANGMQKNGT
jgi:hypothetical protein